MAEKFPRESAKRLQNPRQPPAAQSSWILFKRPWHEIFIHVTVSFGALMLFRSIVGDVSDVYQKNKSTFPVGDSIGKSYVVTNCSRDYEGKLEGFHAYLPPSCGLYITDTFGAASEVNGLLRMVRAIFELGSTTMKEESSIFDFHTWTLSRGPKYVNIFQYLKKKKKPLLSSTDVNNYNTVIQGLLTRVSGEYQVPQQRFHLAQPTFFSKLSSLMPSARSEYWHPYVGDAQSRGSLVHYTAVLYLGTYGKDFSGGRVTVVDDNNRTHHIEPKLGRLIFYNCGSEVVLQQVASGFRYALVASFTLDQSGAIGQPVLAELEEDSQSPTDAVEHN